jgi:hypothetical protein
VPGDDDLSAFRESKVFGEIILELCQGDFFHRFHRIPPARRLLGIWRQ